MSEDSFMQWYLNKLGYHQLGRMSTYFGDSNPDETLKRISKNSEKSCDFKNV